MWISYPSNRQPARPSNIPSSATTLPLHCVVVFSDAKVTFISSNPSPEIDVRFDSTPFGSCKDCASI